MNCMKEADRLRSYLSEEPSAIVGNVGGCGPALKAVLDRLDELEWIVGLVRQDLPSPPWRPIETAPKDGTKFDVWVPSRFGGYRMADLSFNARGQLRQHGLLTNADLPRWPTHWMPTPAAPGSDGEMKENCNVTPRN